MDVEERGLFHIQFQEEDGPIVVMLSDEMADTYREIERTVEVVLGSAIGVELNPEILPDLVNRLLCFLSADLGPATIEIAAVAFALGRICDMFIVKGYEVIRIPAVLGKAKLGMTKLGDTSWGIEPVPLQ